MEFANENNQVHGKRQFPASPASEEQKLIGRRHFVPGEPPAGDSKFQPHEKRHYINDTQKEEESKAVGRRQFPANASPINEHKVLGKKQFHSNGSAANAEDTKLEKRHYAVADAPFDQPMLQKKHSVTNGTK
ncbi:hypothetical protein PMAYCL1PPCAC_32165 [Pristionchus mayeri]|uniref:Uncharacterized protein n=1 Tax=Pristionchus mayeri TaxID=1317129 RepID=A0AAN5DFU6_9BILA|nr:hypothetical protein PMAYCL1PPCAC_32165 [Pristionchus mayeri]